MLKRYKAVFHILYNASNVHTIEVKAHTLHKARIKAIKKIIKDKNTKCIILDSIEEYKL